MFSCVFRIWEHSAAYVYISSMIMAFTVLNAGNSLPPAPPHLVFQTSWVSASQIPFQTEIISEPLMKHMCTYVTYAHTMTHECTHRYRYKDTCTHSNMHTEHTSIPMYTQRQTHRHMYPHMYTQAYIHTENAPTCCFCLLVFPVLVWTQKCLSIFV